MDEKDAIYAIRGMVIDKYNPEVMIHSMVIPVPFDYTNMNGDNRTALFLNVVRIRKGVYGMVKISDGIRIESLAYAGKAAIERIAEMVTK
ncbi:MAG: hypothetical protein LIP09_12355 [Bacteroidales bacterium]|nr:hypothetical protein [Bacteroidales bacterium]